LMATKGYGGPEVEQVYARARAVPTAGRDAAALPGAVGTAAILPDARGVSEGTRVGTAATHPGAAGARPCAPPPGPLCTREYPELFWRARCRSGASGAGAGPLRSP